MNSIEDFITLVRDELGIPVTSEDIGRPFDEMPSWDSVYMLQLMSILERETGRPVSLPGVMRASSLKSIYALVATP
uniref:Putative acyl carrier protein n=1 Tax=Streptomyces versipellis TaxID=67375 RepID=A0A0B6VPA0_9ACTN|nr:putative acyl carrier protein [Streptomyces versipellis]